MALTQRIFALILATSVPAFAFSAPAHAATPEAKAVADAQLSVGVTVAHGDATAVGTASAAFGSEAAFSLEADDHRHDLRITVNKVDGAETLAVKISYKRDGKAIIKKKSIKAKAGIATIRAADGSVVTLKFGPAKPKRRRIEMPEGDDPLTGV